MLSKFVALITFFKTRKNCGRALTHSVQIYHPKWCPLLTPTPLAACSFLPEDLQRNYSDPQRNYRSSLGFIISCFIPRCKPSDMSNSSFVLHSGVSSVERKHLCLHSETGSLLPQKILLPPLLALTLSVFSTAFSLSPVVINQDNFASRAKVLRHLWCHMRHSWHPVHRGHRCC